jgi:hypothetical protein
MKKRDHLGNQTYTKEDNTKVDLKRTGCECIDWSHLAQNGIKWWAFMNTRMNILVP